MSAATNQIKVGNCVIAERKASNRTIILANLRLREIEKVIVCRHGQTIPDTDDGMIYIHAAGLNGAAETLFGWCSRWAPWASEDLIENVAKAVSNRKNIQKPDAVAKLLSVNFAERERLGLRTIGANDVSSKKRKSIVKALKRQRDRDRMLAKRRAQGRTKRSVYEAKSLSHLEPWVAEGISRATWYRRRCETGQSRIESPRNGDTLVSNLLSDPEIESNQASARENIISQKGSRKMRSMGSGLPESRGLGAASSPHGEAQRSEPR